MNSFFNKRYCARKEIRGAGEAGGITGLHTERVVMIDVTKEQISPHVNVGFCAEWVNSL